MYNILHIKMSESETTSTSDWKVIRASEAGRWLGLFWAVKGLRAAKWSINIVLKDYKPDSEILSNSANNSSWELKGEYLDMISTSKSC